MEETMKLISKKTSAKGRRKRALERLKAQKVNEQHNVLGLYKKDDPEYYEKSIKRINKEIETLEGRI